MAGPRPRPGGEVVCASEHLEFGDYIRSIGDEELAVDVLVGDLQRVIEYRNFAFTIEPEVPGDVHALRAPTALRMRRSTHQDRRALRVLPVRVPGRGGDEQRRRGERDVTWVPKSALGRSISADTIYPPILTTLEEDA